MDQKLHSQKLDILARLIKADHITLAEALLLLESESEKQPQTLPNWTPPSYWTNPITVGGSSGTFTLTTNPPLATTTVFTSARTTDTTYTA